MSSGWVWIAVALVAALVVLALVVAGRKKADSAAPPLADPDAPAALADPSGEGVLAADAKPLDAEVPAEAPAVVVDTLPPVEAPPVAAPPAPRPPPPAPPPPLAPPPPSVAAPLAPPPPAAPRPAPKPYEPVTVTVAPTPPRPPPPVVERVLAISPATAAEWDAAEPLPLSPVQATALAMLVAPAAAGGEKLAVSFGGEAALRLARGEPGAAQALAAAAGSGFGLGSGSTDARSTPMPTSAPSASPAAGGKPRWLDSVAAQTLAANALAAIANSRHLGALGDECRDLKTAIAAWPAKPAGGGEPRLKPIVHDAARFAREARDNYPSVVGKAAFRERIVVAWGSARDVWRDAMARSDALRQQLEPPLAAPRFGEVQVERALALWRESSEAGQQLDLAVRLLAGLHTLRVAVGESPSPAEGDVLRSALAALSAGAEQDADLAARTAAREKEAKGDPYVGRGEFEANRAALRKLVARADPQAMAATLARVERAASARPPGIDGRLLVALVGNVCEMRLPAA